MAVLQHNHRLTNRTEPVSDVQEATNIVAISPGSMQVDRGFLFFTEHDMAIFTAPKPKKKRNTCAHLSVKIYHEQRAPFGPMYRVEECKDCREILHREKIN